jgi:excisionase family DNA binding protein
MPDAAIGGRIATVEPLMSVDDVAEVLGISVRGVFRLLRRGDLVAVKVGNRTRVEPDELRTYIANQRRAADSKESEQ